MALWKFTEKAWLAVNLGESYLDFTPACVLGVFTLQYLCWWLSLIVLARIINLFPFINLTQCVSYEVMSVN